MAEFKFDHNREDGDSDKRFRKQFNLNEGEEYLPMERKEYPLMSNNSEKGERSFKEYLNLDEAYNSIHEVLEEICETKKCTIEQADVLNTNFAKLLVGIYQLNRKNLHNYYFKKLKNTDYEILNKSLLYVINSNLTFDDITKDVENNKDVRKQILELFDPIFKEAFSKDVGVCLSPRNDEFIHLFTLQTAITLGYIAGRDLKKGIRSNRYFSFEYLDDIEFQTLSDIYHILSLTYPYNGTMENFNLNDLFPIKREITEYARQIKMLQGKDWREKADWLNSKLEEVEAQKRVMSYKEKEIFESVLSMLSMEINTPQNGEDIEVTRQKAKDIVLDAYFKAFLAYYNGDDAGYERNMEITRKTLLKVIYIIDFEKSNKGGKE